MAPFQIKVYKMLHRVKTSKRRNKNIGHYTIRAVTHSLKQYRVSNKHKTQ